jgi:hypothetical protein
MLVEANISTLLLDLPTPAVLAQRFDLLSKQPVVVNSIMFN